MSLLSTAGTMGEYPYMLSPPSPVPPDHFKCVKIQTKFDNFGTKIDNLSACALCAFQNNLPPTNLFPHCPPRHLLVLMLPLSMRSHKSLAMCFSQGNSKGESDVAAILQSHMEASYRTSGFFCS